MSVGKPRWSRIFRTTLGSSIKAISFIRPWQRLGRQEDPDAQQQAQHDTARSSRTVSTRRSASSSNRVPTRIA